jgi:hypothetical protein
MNLVGTGAALANIVLYRTAHHNTMCCNTVCCLQGALN